MVQRKYHISLKNYYNENEISLLELPIYSPDLNPIKISLQELDIIWMLKFRKFSNFKILYLGVLKA